MDIIKEIHSKYSALESEVDNQLDIIKREENKLAKQNARSLEKSSTRQTVKILSYEEALARNNNLLKSLEIAKARLRSRSTYSPVEGILRKALDNFEREFQMSFDANNTNETGETLNDDTYDNIN
uniref:Uncharacterized protein n=1 Tax=Glossina morsitans morsitans TaxID=37546 RepID=A0A1B0FEQ3_GLOMM